MKSRMKSAKIIKMTPAAENAIDDEDALGKAIAASWAAIEKADEMDLTNAESRCYPPQDNRQRGFWRCFNPAHSAKTVALLLDAGQIGTHSAIEGRFYVEA